MQQWAEQTKRVADEVTRTGHYVSGQPYRLAKGRAAPREGIEDQLRNRLAVVDLDRQFLDASEFQRLINRELKIRFYRPNTQSNYRSHLSSFLRWFGGTPHSVTREHVRDYLEYLVDAGLEPTTVGNHLSAIRTAFDKFCFREITLGLVIPRRRKTRPLILSHQEIRRLLKAATSIRDKLCLGLMYATGLRVSEVVALRYRDINFDRGSISVWRGKGNRDRTVTLPSSFKPLLHELKSLGDPDRFLFPSESPRCGRSGSNRRTVSRYLSPRSVQRIIKRALAIAGIDKPATPHTLRHTFATHSFENGCDIRRIQAVLGHANLETTTIYVQVAKPSSGNLPSPIDQMDVDQMGVDQMDSAALDPNSERDEPSASAGNPASQPQREEASKRTNRRSGYGEASWQKANRATSPQGVSKDESRSPPVGRQLCPANRPSVGKLQILFGKLKSLQGELPETSVTLAVRKAEFAVHFSGIVLRLVRPGWVEISIPPEERWQSSLTKLTTQQQERFREPEFYQLLQQELSRRFLAMVSNSKPTCK